MLYFLTDASWSVEALRYQRLTLILEQIHRQATVPDRVAAIPGLLVGLFPFASLMFCTRLCRTLLLIRSQIRSPLIYYGAIGCCFNRAYTAVTLPDTALAAQVKILSLSLR